MNDDPAEWHDARPFPHLVTKIPAQWDHAVREAEREFPDPSSTLWHTFDGEHERGKQEGSSAICGGYVALLHDYLAGAEVVTMLRALTGIRDLIPDPLRVGGGVHQVPRGAFLDVHHDFTLHPVDPNLERRVNVLLFLTREWEPGFGGELLLGVGDDQVVIPPTAETLVIFEASAKSWHGHPTVWEHDHPRRSIPAYYYAPRRDGAASTSTVWWNDE